MFAPLTGLSELFVTALFSDQIGCPLRGLFFSCPQQMATVKPLALNQMIRSLYGCLFLPFRLKWRMMTEVCIHTDDQTEQIRLSISMNTNIIIFDLINLIMIADDDCCLKAINYPIYEINDRLRHITGGVDVLNSYCRSSKRQKAAL